MKWLFGKNHLGRMTAVVATAATLAHAEPVRRSTSTAMPTFPPAPAAEATRTVVLVQSRIPAATEARLPENLRWQLSELNLGLREVRATHQQALQDFVKQAEQIASSGDVLLVAWVTQVESTTSIYLFDPNGPHLYARRVAVSDSPAAASEELALIVRSALQARLDGGSLAMPEIALPAESAVKPSRPPPTLAHAESPQASSAPRSPSPTAFDWGAGMSGVVTRPFNRGDWQVGLAVRSWVRWRPVRFGIGYAAFPSLDIATDRAAMAVYRRPLELFAAFEWSTDRIAFVAESMLGLDAMQRQTTRVSPPLSARASDERWLVTVGERLRSEVKLMSPVWLSVAGGIEVPLNPHSFELESAGQRVTIAEVLPVRPAFEMGLVVR